MSAQNVARSSRLTGRAHPGTRTNAISALARMNATAVAHSVDSAPTSAINTPPTPGATRKAVPKIASWMPFARSRRRPAALAAAGSMVSRAVAPAGSKSAPTAPSSINQPTVSEPIAPTIGIAATLAALNRSETTEVRRRPTRSTRVPANSAVAIRGSALTAATSPAAEALPVSSSTSHGSAIIAMPLPVAESRVAVSSAMNGPR